MYDRQLHVFAYDVLFHSGDTHQAGCLAPSQATAQVLLNTVLDIGWETIAGHKRAFITCLRDFLLLDYVQALPADRVGITVPEDIAVDAALVQVLRTLSAQGYLIALDDLLFYDTLGPLVELADLVKIDVRTLDRPMLEAHVAVLHQYEVTLVAKNVETPDDFTACRALGFDYFQGDFFCQPHIITGRRSPVNRLALLHLLAELQNPAVAFEELETLISRDVSLSYKLLRVVNAAFYSRPTTIASIRQALLFLGTQAITTWVSLILLTTIDDKPHELMIIAMVRAKMCEQLAEVMGQEGKASFFLVGLFSVLDALIDRPMAEVLQSLPLAEPIIRALLFHEGVLGTTLRCVLAYERCMWDEVTRFGLDARRVTDAYLKALVWADTMRNTLALDDSLFVRAVSGVRSR
jgi:EAL and modified HD-GYP domain-containing signal transduction protein